MYKVVDFNNHFTCSSIIVIVGSPFQGKSILSAKLSSEIEYFTVIGTDIIRDLLRITNPNYCILKSTSNLNMENLKKQRTEISTIVYYLLKNYSNTQEKVIFEGMHFSKEVIKFVISNGGLVFFLDNKIEWEERFYLRSLSCRNSKYTNSSGKITYKKIERKSGNSDLYYTDKVESFKMIHEVLKKDCIELNAMQIEFTDLQHAFLQIKEIIKNRKSSEM